ncbi:MAG: hypothetical protein M3Q64_01150 [bacterium]|nr:hypothetical protein [bacterium]
MSIALDDGIGSNIQGLSEGSDMTSVPEPMSSEQADTELSASENTAGKESKDPDAPGIGE